MGQPSATPARAGDALDELVRREAASKDVALAAHGGSMGASPFSTRGPDEMHRPLSALRVLGQA